MSYYALCIATFIAAYTINMLYMSVFYHRGLTHGAVKLEPWALKLVVKTGNWVTGIDPKGWVCMHRLHHEHADTELDPHSPTYYGIFGTLNAQVASYKKVLRRLNRRDPATTALVADLDFSVSPLNKSRIWWAPYAIHVAIGLALCLLFDARLLGAAYFAGMMSHPVQGWLVNSFGHAKGYRNFETDDDSRNNTLVAWFVMGEGYQNNHHRFPHSARFSVRWFEFDPGYLLCLAMRAIGAIEIVGEAPNWAPRSKRER
jgi:stearoyl-CoA desaturase (Delta-9 desaturase)